jgi:nucleoside-diphosphate-sugar epimerase
MILITGRLGFIGLHTAQRFLDVGESVVRAPSDTRTRLPSRPRS